MRNNLLPVATIGAALLAVIGATTTGRNASQTQSGSGRGPSAATGKIAAAGAAKPTPADLEDPVRKARRLAQQESNATLKQSICGFLAEYEDASTTVDAQPHAAAPTNTYCTYTQADLAEAVDPDHLPKPGPAVRPKVILAILPDPVHTQLALRFDESADELQNSLQDLGWTYDRAWLPWDNNNHEDAADFDERMENKYGQESYETSGGAIMFRADPKIGASQPLIVLVAGDSPTGGVNPDQFQSAIAIWQQLTGWSNYFDAKNPDSTGATAPDANQLLILGPTFSGSTPSLKGLLRAVTKQAHPTKQASASSTDFNYFCPSQPLTISIVSGTVTDNIGLGDLETPTAGACNRSLKVVARSLSVDMDYEYIHLLAFIQSHENLFASKQGSTLKIARLTEAESSYGSLYKFEAKPITQPGGEADGISGESNDDKNYRLAQKLLKRDDLPDDLKRLCVNIVESHDRNDSGAKVYRPLNPLHFYFPREISKLRAAYEQNKIFGFSSSSGSVQTQLHLSLSGSTHDDDTIRTFSGDQGAAAMESAMAQLAGELDRLKVNLVILSATDVLDELFVTRYLAQHAPNLSVIVTDADGLFLRGADSSMQNAFVVTPWPLLPGNEEWSLPPDAGELARYNNLRDWDKKARWPDPHGREHNSASGEGLYSATKFLICNSDPHPNLLTNCGAVLDADKTGFLRRVALAQYRTPIATWAAKTNDLINDPPLWLSAVGRGGFWPISLVDLDQAGDRLPETSDTNMPRLIKINFAKDGTEEILPAPESRGIVEQTSRSIIIATGVIAFLLALHGLASLRARLDRGFAWSYALSDKMHHHWRRKLQIVITLLAIPALVLLKTRIEAGVAIRGPLYTEFNWTLQIAALLLTAWPMLQLADAWPGSWLATMPTRQKVRNCVTFSLAFFLEVIFMFACNWWLWETITPSANKWPSERALVFYRSGHLFCGSAPNLPVLLLGAAIGMYLVNIFDRLVFYSNRIPLLPTVDQTLRCPGPKQLCRLNSLLAQSWDRWRLILLTGVLIVLGLFIIGLNEVIPRSLTHGRFDVTVISMSAIVTFLLVFDLAMAATAWTFLRSDCLMPLSHSPLRWGFTWIKGWSWTTVLAPGAFSSDRVVEYLRRLDEINQRSLKDPALTKAFNDSKTEWEKPMRNADWAADVTAAIGQLNLQIANTAEAKLAWLKSRWSQDYGPITGTQEHERGLMSELPIEKYSLDNPQDLAAWRDTHDRMAQEEFVALLYLGYVRMVLLQIRNRIMTAAGMYILLMWALTSYPFLNHHFILVGLTCLLGILAAAVIWIYAQMHRDDILSRTTETPTGKLDADFFTKILSMVGIPLLTLIASQFPEVSNAVFSWLEPGLSSMK